MPFSTEFIDYSESTKLLSLIQMSPFSLPRVAIANYKTQHSVHLHNFITYIPYKAYDEIKWAEKISRIIKTISINSCLPMRQM